MIYYDRMDWHYNVDYPESLPKENGGTHIGMFLAWIIDNNLYGNGHKESSSGLIDEVLNRVCTGRDFLIQRCNEQLSTDDLNEEGNSFAQYYYDISLESKFSYINDYCKVFESQISESIYEVENTWENYDRLKQIINNRYKHWKMKVLQYDPHVL